MPSHSLTPQIQQVLHSLQQRMPGFCARQSQVVMIDAVADALTADDDGQRIAVVEAPCGVGKSVGYSVAGILASKERDMPVIIATGTVALQEQLCNKDLPALQAFGGLDFTFVIAKGRGRYLCPAKLANLTRYDGSQEDLLRRGESAAPVSDAKPTSDAGMYALMADMLGKQRWSGDRDALPFPVEDKTWRKLTNDRHGCVGSGCRFRQECPFFAARAHLRSADVIVTNHDLLLSDLAMGGGTILPEPEKALLVIDEGHGLPERAIEHFAGETILSDDASWIAKMIAKVQATRSILDGKKNDEVRMAIAGAAPHLVSALTRLRAMAAAEVEGMEPLNGRSDVVTKRFTDGLLPEPMQSMTNEAATLCGELVGALEKLLKQLSEEAKEAVGGSAAEKLGVEIGESAGRLASMRDALILFGEAEPPGVPPVARWVESIPKRSGEPILKVCASPISSASRLAACLWSRFAGVVSTSATLRTVGTFDRYLRRAGIARNPQVRTVAVDSPFDFERNGLLALPKMQNDPGNSEKFTQELIDVLPQIIRRREATLVLFCSKWQMQKVAEGVPAGMRQSILIQGTEDRTSLLAKHAERVKAGRSSIIFGMASFAEGLDLPGSLCEHVVISKLPFRVPDSPVEAAIVEWLTKIGRNAFMEVAVPDAALKLTQACGRLLRSETDKGTVTILDRRVTTARYGEMLLSSLPPFARHYGLPTARAA